MSSEKENNLPATGCFTIIAWMIVATLVLLFNSVHQENCIKNEKSGKYTLSRFQKPVEIKVEKNKHYLTINIYGKTFQKQCKLKRCPKPGQLYDCTYISYDLFCSNNKLLECKPYVRN